MKPPKIDAQSAVSGDADPTSKHFTARLFRYPGAGGWHFAPIPDKHAPSVTHGWGRTPVRAAVDSHEWKTSVWRGRDGRTLLAIPKRVRGTKGHGDTVDIRVTFDGPPR